MLYWVHPKVFDHLGWKIRSHSLKEKYLNYKHQQCQSIHNENVFYFHFSIDGVLKIVPRLMMIMMVTFLSDVRNNAKSFEKLRAIWAVWEGSPQPCKLLKTKMLLSGLCRAPPLAAAWSGTSLTHHCFVNNYTRSLQREKVNAQFPLSYISDISHQDWCSSGWWMNEYRAGTFFQN